MNMPRKVTLARNRVERTRPATCRGTGPQQAIWNRPVVATMIMFVFAAELALTSEAFSYTKSVITPHREQQEWNWCGPACAQMILECDTIVSAPGRTGADYPGGTIGQIQQILWNFIQAHKTASWHTDPDGLEAALDHYDTTGLYVQYAENDAAWSCKKLAWTIEHYDVPPAILVSGGYHWNVVYRLDTSTVPTLTDAYSINGFNCLDPGCATGSLGADTYRTYDAFICHFNPVSAALTGPWDDLRVSVCDPDIVTPDLIVGPPLQPGDVISADAAVAAAQTAIQEHGLQQLPGFAEALDGAELAQPVLVNWPSCDVGPCYCIPVTRLGGERGWLLTAVVTVHGATGQLMEATYSAEPFAPELDLFYDELTYPFTTRESSACAGFATPAPSILSPPGREPIKINFQPEDAVVPYGCLPDFGHPFADRGNGYSYGWNAPNYETRDRDAHSDQRYDTLNHMQRPSNPHGIWQIALPNGSYDVLVLCGDPSYSDQTNHLHINCQPLRDPDEWPGGDNTGSDFDVFELRAQVTEGLLSIEPGADANNAKICFVKITPAAPGPVTYPQELIGVDVGGPEPMGSVELCPLELCQWAITAGGADIWGTTDQFYYAQAQDANTGGPLRILGDFTAVVRVKGMEPAGTVDGWAKAGIMVRESLDPASAHTMVVRTPGNGVALQGRDTIREESWHEPLGSNYGPGDAVWLRLDRVGRTFTASYFVGGSTPPILWTGATSHDSLLSDDVLIGLATTSHEQGVPVTAEYADFSIGPVMAGGGGGTPKWGTWTSLDTPLPPGPGAPTWNGAEAIAVGRRKDRLELFAVGTDGNLWYRAQAQANSSNWAAWKRIGQPSAAGLRPALEAVRRTDGELDVFALAFDNTVRRARLNSSLSWAWDSLGKPSVSSGTRNVATMAVGQYEDGRLVVFAIDQEGHALWYRKQLWANGPWAAGWTGLGKPAGIDLLTVAVGRNEDGRLEVFAGGGKRQQGEFAFSDGKIWWRWENKAGGSWNVWTEMGKKLPAMKFAPDPVVGQNKDGRMEIFTVGNSGTLWRRSQVLASGGWSIWKSESPPSGWQLLTPLAVGSHADGRLELVTLGITGTGPSSTIHPWHRWHIWPNGAAWSNWSKLGSLKASESLETMVVGENNNGLLEVFGIVSEDRTVRHIRQQQ